MESENRIYQNIKAGVVMIITVFWVCFMLLSNLWTQRDWSAESDYTAGWTTDRGETVDSDDIAAGEYEGGVTISKVLPEISDADEGLCFISYDISFAVYVEGKAVYEYLPRKNLTGYSYGTAYHTIRLGPEQSGRKVEIEMHTLYSGQEDGQIGMLSVENMSEYRKRLATGQLVPFNISVAVMGMGMLLILLGLFIPRREPQTDITALGLTAVCTGIWLANDTGFLRLIFDAVYISRVTDHLFMILWILPFMVFVYSVTKERRRSFRNLILIIYGIGILILFTVRFVFDREMGEGLLWVLLLYSSLCVISALMIISDYKFRTEKKINTDLKQYFIGLAFMIVSVLTDCMVYACGVRSGTGRGNASRVGFVVMFILIGIEALDEYSRERKSNKRDRVINRMLQYAVSTNDHDTNIHAILEYFGKEYSAEHTFIYENRQNGTFHNTYEWFGEKAPRDLYAEYQDIPYEGLIDKLQDAFKRDHCVILDDSEKTREINAKLYELLKSTDVNNMVVGPLEYDGELIGVLGIDDAPKESGKEIADIIWLMSYFVTQLLVGRNEKRNLVRYSYFDSLTGTKNRRALEEFEADCEDVYPYGYVMCDINGLKRTNDTEGHDAGDRLIIDISDSLKEAFGEANVYRVGGDEFAVYASVSSSEELERLVKSARDRIAGRGRSASIGAVFVKDDSVSRSEIKEKADQLMYEEKEIYYRGRNDRRIY